MSKLSSQTIRSRAVAFCAAMVFVLTGAISTAHADTQAIMSWKATNYVPSWYKGRVMPGYGSRVTVGLDVLENGKIADISKKTIRWYMNDNLVQNETNGLGLQSYTFRNSSLSQDPITVRVSILDYNGQPLDQLVRIPVVSPEVVIDAPYYDRRIEKGSSIFSALPFFFNIANPSQLRLAWNINGADMSGDKTDPNKLTFVMPAGVDSGTEFAVKATADSLNDIYSSAEKTVQFLTK